MPATPSPRSVAEVGYPRISDTLGREIVTGVCPPGHVMTLETLAGRFGASRTVLREAMRVLESIGLLESRRRVGLVVRPPAEWNVFDPRVIAWRLETDQRIAQLRTLTQLRLAVEPLAAHFAALEADQDQRDELLRLAALLREQGEGGQGQAFLASDRAFHALILEASGNDLFAALQHPIGEVLTGRTQHGLMPARPRREALDLHDALAHAIADGDPSAAETAAAGILREVRDALASDFPAAMDDA